jgi:hypothetical protein
MNSLRRFALICLLILTASCGIEVSDKLDTHYVTYRLANAAAEETGYVVGSIGLMRKAKNFQTYRFKARPVGGDDRFEFFFYDQSSFTYRPDFVDNGADVRLFATPLRAGRYEIYWYEYSAMRLMPFLHDDSQDRPPQEFSLPFEVKPGQTTYLGQFKAVPHLGKPVLGTPNIFAYYWEIGDRRARDIAAAQQRLPGVKADSLITAIPDPASSGLRYFVKDGATPPDWPIGPAN